MADAVKISELPDVTSFGREDLFVVNDITGPDEITSKISVGSFVNWITSEDLRFTGTLQVGNIVPDPVNGFNVTVNSIYIKDEITVSPYAIVEGLELDDLDDVEIDTGLLTHGQLLMWDSVDNIWVNEFLNVDNADDQLFASISDLRDSIDALNDSIDMLVDELEDKVDPAPNDGAYYVMKDGQWFDITDLLIPFTNYLVYDGGADPR